MTVTRRQVLDLRVAAQQLDRAGGTLADTAVLDLGVQDSGPDGGLWALTLRGVDVGALPGDALAILWTVRAAPHLYRRADLPGVLAATAPFSEADAGKRIHDAAKPLRAAGIGTVEALDTIAATMRSVVTAPTAKGELSGRLAELLDPVHLRYCRPCDATHVWEMPFRLAASRAGLELQAGTSPPVLQPVPGLTRTDAVPQRLDVVRGYLRMLGPATPGHVAGYLDAPLQDVRARWPEDAVEVSVEGERRWLLAGDAGRLADLSPASGVRLLGPFDLLLQARDRELLVPERDRAKTLWPALGRPGGVLVDGEVAGTWRARRSGAGVAVSVQLWEQPTAELRRGVTAGAEQLAAYRGRELAGVAFD